MARKLLDEKSKNKFLCSPALTELPEHIESELAYSSTVYHVEEI